MANGRFRNTLMGLAAIGAVVLTTVASAAPSTLRFTNTNAWDQSGAGDARGGGPFEVIPTGLGDVQGLGANGAAAGSYLTFCVELNEHIGRSTYNAVENTEAINGGVGGGNPDPLDYRTAFLYTAFIKGNLDNKLASASLGVFTYGAGLAGIAMQEAIWVIEEEVDISTVSDLAKDILALAGAAVTGTGEWVGKGIGNVRILNLTTNDGEHRQDQLMLIPLPIPALLGLAGLAGVGVFSRRRRQVG